MPAARSRRLAATGSLSLALLLLAPASALAAPGGEPAGRERSDREQQQDEQAPQRGGEQPREDRASSGERSASRPSTSASQQRPAASSSARREGQQRRSARPADERDPAGNNGTIKVDGAPFDDGKGNEPHVGCTFRIVHWGFDAGDRATITLTGIAPTGGGLLHTESGTLVSDDAAGGGQDRDAALVFTVSDQLQELLSVAPHAQQGWHVKVAVDVEGAPGGAKQKVLWIDCPTAAAPAADDVTVTSAGTPEPAPVELPVEPTFGGGGTTVDVADRRLVSGTGGAGEVVAATFGGGGLVLDAVATGGARQQTAGTQVRPSVLPFTGTELALALAAGLAALAVGGGLAYAGHRRETV